MDQNAEINEEITPDDPELEFINPAPSHQGSLIGETDLTSSTQVNWPVRLIGCLTFLSGLVAAVQPLAARIAAHPRLFSILVPYDSYHLSKSLHVVLGLFLIYLSINLFKRKENAWYAAILLALLSAILHAAQMGAEHIGFIRDAALRDFIPQVTFTLPVLTVVLLSFYRKQFTVKSERPRLSAGLDIFALSLCLVIAYGTVGFFLLEPHDFGLNFELVDAFVRAVREIFFVGNIDLIPRTRFAYWFLHSLHVFGGLAAVYVAYSIFRPIHYKLTTQDNERRIAENLLKLHGKDALDHYKTLPDKSYFFLPDGKGFIAYKTVLNVAIALGDPIAADDELERVTQEFRTLCRNNDWKVAFLQVKPDNLEMFKRIGLDVLKVGEEAVIDLDKFVATTSKGKNFKSKVKKLEKDGYVLECHKPPHTKLLIDSIEAVSNEWLSLPGRRERGFSLGWFDRESVEKETLFILKDKEGQPLAFVNQVPSYAPGEVSIDMMRHKENVPNGTMDFLFVKLLTALHDNGFHFFNLGLAALSGVGDEPGASLEERAIKEIYEHMNRFFSYKGLRKYKDKFDPEWKESFLVYEGGPPGLLKTALAITRAGELTWDD